MKQFIGAYRHGVRFKGFKDLHRHHMAIEVARQKLHLSFTFALKLLSTSVGRPLPEALAKQAPGRHAEAVEEKLI